MTRGAVKVLHRRRRASPLCTALWEVDNMGGVGVVEEKGGEKKRNQKIKEAEKREKE